MSSRFRDQHGRVLQLGPKLGEGGEGAVYRLAGQGSQAIKIYAAPLSAERVQKIKILIQLNKPDVGQFIAWPTGLVMDEKGQARGLLLPVVEQGKDIHHLYTPSSRRQHFPAATWHFLVHVSRNVASAFHAVHARDLVIGDVNPGSILVLADGTVRLIDVDSFQVPVPNQPPLLCTVAVPLFLPPELQKAQLNSVVRTPNHDAFGLAITIFQLLMLGRHPYAGRYLGTGEMLIERAITEHRFAYSAQAANRDMQRPPNTVGMEILPAPVSALFESAFAPTAGQRRRPSAEDWVQALDQLAAGLRQCGRSPAHHYSQSASTCPWCAFEQATNVVLFAVPATRSLRAYETDYQKLIDLIAAVPKPQPVAPPTASFRVVPNPAAQNATKTSGAAWGGYVLGLLLIVGGMALLPGGMMLVGLGVAVAIFVAATAKSGRQTWASAYRIAKTEQARAAENLEQANRFPAHTAARAAAAQASQSWNDLPRLQAEKHRQLERNKRQVQLQKFLQGKLLKSASITGIGPGRVAMLSAYGIDTADDIVTERVAQVPQFGPVLTDRLVGWRQNMERAFVYDPSRPLPREAVDRVEKDIEDAQRRVVEDLRRALSNLKAVNANESATAKAAAQLMGEATRALRQAEADFIAATGKVPV
jgi:DNA-binding helix-hairpin-helix protein with protein kinase domain